MIAEDVRDMLQRQAAAVRPSPEAWARIVARIDTPMVAMPIPLPRPARRRPWENPMMMAAAAVIAVLVAAVVIIGNDAGDRLDVADGPPTGPANSSTPGHAAATAPIWPVTDIAQLTDTGDGAEVARRYLAEFVPGAKASAFEPAQDGSAGIVRYTVNGVEGQVQLARVDGKWFVTGAGSSAIDVHMLTYDGNKLTGEARPAVAGSLRLTVAGVNGPNKPVSPPAKQVAADAAVPISVDFSDTAAVILTVRLGDGFAQYRVESSGAKPPVPATSVDGHAAADADADAVRTFVQALNRGDMAAAWELVDERSRRAIGGFNEFKSMRAELSEGWGGWARVKDAAYYSVPLTTPGVSAVIIIGTRAQEGPPQVTSSALPVRSGKVDPFVRLGDVEFGAADATWINVSVPAGTKAWFIVDDGSPIRADVDGTKATASVEPPLKPGRHHLTVVLEGANGALATVTFDYAFR